MGYAVLNLRTISVKLLFLVGFIIPEAYAMSEGSVEQETPPLQLHATRFWQPPERIPENVTVLTEEDLEALPARNLAEVLKYVPGVDVDTRTKFGHSATFGMQGANADQIRVMIDGIDFNNQSSGQSILAEIPIANVKQIEIIKGSVSSSRWGSALGGVINVVTKDTGDTILPKISATSLFSEHQQKRTFGDVAGGVENLGYYFFWEYGEAEGTRDQEDVMNANGQFKVSYDVNEEHQFIVSGGLIEADQHEGLFPDNTNFRTDYEAKFGKIHWNYDPDERRHFHVSGRTNFQDIQQTGGQFTDELWGIDGESVFRLRESDTLVFGFDTSFERFKTLSIPTATDLYTIAGYGNYNLQFNPVTLSFGLRYDGHSDFNNQFSPNIGVVIAVPKLEKTFVRATFARGYQAPPLLRLYFNNGVLIPNPELKPERAWTWQFGFDSEAIPHVKTKLNFYYSMVDDAIISVSTVGGGVPFQFQNQSRFRRMGIEGEVRVDVFEGFELLAAGSINDVENRQTDAEVFSTGFAQETVNLGMIYRHPVGFLASFLGNYQRNRATGFGGDENHLLFDLKISQEVPITDIISIKGFLNIYNIFNSPFQIDSFYPYPDRYFEFGFTTYFG